MPLIHIESLPVPGVDRKDISRKVNLAVAEAISARRDAVWTTWRTIDVDVRGDQALTDSSKPVVHVYHHRTAEQVGRIVAVIQAVLARELSISADDIFVTTQPVSMPDPTLD